MPVRPAPLLALVALAPLGCAAGIVPPSLTEVGTTVIARGGQPQSGMRVATGAHLASGRLSRDASLDVGAGYVFERVGAAGGPGARSLALGGDAPVDEAAPALDHQDSHGFYVEVSRAVQRAHAHRSWLGARAEVARQIGPDGVRDAAGLYGRVGWELFTSGEGAGAADTGCGFGAGFARGALGVGLFLESGARWTEGQGPGFVAIGGLSVRMPLMGGILVHLCKC